MNTNNYSKHIALNNVKINDTFWSAKQQLVMDEVIPYQYNALHDKVDGAEKSYCIDNFKKAASIVKRINAGEDVPTYPADSWHYGDDVDSASFHGWVFQDSDLYKWLEAAGYALAIKPNDELKTQVLKCIDLICSAQLDNGYLDTLYIINNRDKAFSNLKDYHELYCFGHLTEAAVSIYNSIGNDKLLNCAVKFANLICNTFGADKVKGYPGHEIAEMALVKLYEVTDNAKYLNMARFFVDERGTKPYYYDLVLGKKTVNDNYHYNQAHIQPRFQTEAVGHAVRGTYLYSAMADIAKRYNDTELYAACTKIFDNIQNKKMYITGGIGATVDGEAFSFNYDLPNDLAYSETCASIGLVFFARRMLEIEPNADYADVMERALYNTILSGMALDGKSFFYVNPLEVLPLASKTDSRKKHIKPVRQKWFGCACCPPNIARLLTSLGEYCYTQNDSTIFVHQYIGSNVKSSLATLNIDSSYATDGRVNISVTTNNKFSLALRIPAWCDNYTISAPFSVNNGYAYINIDGNILINVQFNIVPRIVKCSNLVRANVGKVAVTMGPTVYCMEGVDNGDNLQLIHIDPNTAFDVQGDVIIANGYRENVDDDLYSTYAPNDKKAIKIRLIPYYKWANRGENEMSVYIRI